MDAFANKVRNDVFPVKLYSFMIRDQKGKKNSYLVHKLAKSRCRLTYKHLYY